MRKLVFTVAVVFTLFIQTGCFQPSICQRCLQQMSDNLHESRAEIVDVPQNKEQSMEQKTKKIINTVIDYKELIAYIIVSLMSLVIASKLGTTPAYLPKVSAFLHDRCSDGKSKIIRSFNSIVRNKK